MCRMGSYKVGWAIAKIQSRQLMECLVDGVKSGRAGRGWGGRGKRHIENDIL